MTTTRETEQTILDALHQITQHWPAMLTPTTPGSIARPSNGTGALADDHADTDTDTPRLERVLSLRRETTEALASWCLLLIEDRHIPHAMTRCQHGWTTRVTLTWPHIGPTRPRTTCRGGRPWAETENGPQSGLHSIDAANIDDLTQFLQTHAQWMSWHEAGETCADELKDWARKIRAVAQPQRRDWLPIGACPVTTGAEHIACGTQVRAYPDRPGDVTCRGCGTTDTIDGWVLRMVGTEGPFTAEQLVPMLHRRMGIVVGEATIRQWVRRAVIEPVKDGWEPRKTDTGKHLYDLRDVMTRLARRERMQDAPTRVS